MSSLSIVAICLAIVTWIYFYNNPMRHGPWFLSRRFINWFPLGMTYAFLYMGRYNLTVAKNAFGDLMSNDAFGLIFAAGTGNPYFTTDTAAALRHVSTAMVSYPVGTSAAQILRKSCRVVSFGIALATKLRTDDWGEPVC